MKILISWFNYTVQIVIRVDLDFKEDFISTKIQLLPTFFLNPQQTCFKGNQK